MPVAYPSKDPETGELTEVDYFTVGEVAEMFHVSQATVRRRIKAGEWVVFEPVAGAYYMSPDHVAAVVESMTHTVGPPPPDVPEGGKPPRLGVPVDPTDLEGIR